MIKSIYIALILLFSTFTLTACETVPIKKDAAPWLNPNILNSERIEKKFGSYGVLVLAQDEKEGFRLSNLYSSQDGQRMARTIALTLYNPKMSDELKVAHEEILKGGSIGATLKKHGFSVDKQIFFRDNVSTMPDKIRELMHTKATNFAGIMYNLIAEKNGHLYFYCTITELYAPDFLTLSDVKEIYPDSAFLVKDQNITKNNILDELRAHLQAL